MLPKAVEIALLIALPLGWGLAVDCLFEWIHRRRWRPCAPPDRDHPC